MAAAPKSRQGQNVRDKFFMDFVSATTKSSDPFNQTGKSTKSESVDWLPELSFTEETSEHSFVLSDSIFQLQSMFDQGGLAFQ